MKLEFALGFSISLIFFIFSPQLTELLLGDKFAASGELLRIISALPILISLSNLFGIQIMLSLGYDKSFSLIISLSALLHILILFVLVPKYFAVGTSVAVVITEFFVTLLTYLFVQKKKILFSNNEI